MIDPAVPITTPERRPSVASRIWHNYILRRLIRALFIIWLVTTATFFMVRLMPANPVDVFIAQLISQYGMTRDEAYTMAASLFSIDFNQPLHLQYVRYIGNLLHGDLGNSLLSKAPVGAIIAKFLPWTLFSVGISLFLSFTVGVLLGMVMAFKRDSWLDHVLSAFASLMTSIPNYLVAILFIVFLGVQWNVVDLNLMRGSLSPGVQPGLSLTFFRDALFHAGMPILTYFLTTVGRWMLTMKSTTLATIGEDYVTVARARGLTDREITLNYVGRNAMLPLFTLLAIALGFVVGGSILIESYFVYQGIGFTLGEAIARRDYPLMQGVFLMITVAVVGANLLADLLYSKLDPRIRFGEEG